MPAANPYVFGRARPQTVDVARAAPWSRRAPVQCLARAEDVGDGDDAAGRRDAGFKAHPGSFPSRAQSRFSLAIRTTTARYRPLCRDGRAAIFAAIVSQRPVFDHSKPALNSSIRQGRSAKPERIKDCRDVLALVLTGARSRRAGQQRRFNKIQFSVHASRAVGRVPNTFVHGWIVSATKGVPRDNRPRDEVIVDPGRRHAEYLRRPFRLLSRLLYTRLKREVAMNLWSFTGSKKIQKSPAVQGSHLREPRQWNRMNSVGILECRNPLSH
jgi:hypothetical protein